MEGHQIVPAHKGFYRHGLVQEPDGGIGIVGCLNDDDALFFRVFQKLRLHGAAAGHQQQRGLAVHGAALGLFPVGGDDDIIRLDEVLHHLLLGSGDDDAALGEDSFRISAKERSLYGA